MRASGFGGRETRWHGCTPTDVERWFCTSSLRFGSGLSELCTKAFQEWYAVTDSALSDRAIWECMFCRTLYTVPLCMGDLFRRWPCGVTWSYVFIFRKAKYFQSDLTCKNFFMGCLRFFFTSVFFFGGGVTFLFVCFVRFLQCCISQSMLGAKWSFRVMFCGQLFL